MMPISSIASLGQAQEQRQQQQINENMARYNAEQQQAGNALSQYNSFAGANTGLTNTESTMNAADPSFGQRALGGAAAGIGAAALGGTTAGAAALGALGLSAGPVGWAVGIGSALGLFD